MDLSRSGEENRLISSCWLTNIGVGSPTTAFALVEQECLSQVLTVLRDIAKGMCHIHEAGVAHRDLKPANVLLGACGGVRVADFDRAVTLTKKQESLYSTRTSPKTLTRY